MDFETILLQARADDKRSMLQIIEMYRPLLIHYSMVHEEFDEDLYQENVYTMLLCIKKFPYGVHAMECEDSIKEIS